MTIIKGRRQAHPDKPFALFLIGMRVNRLAAIGQWWPVFTAMPRMQAELARNPAAGMLWQKNFISGRITLTLQYWQSVEKLFAYAHDREGRHFPAWAAFNRKLKDNKAVGIWHESYAVTPQAAENIYSNMPAFGLGGAIGVTSAIARMGGLRDPFSRLPKTPNGR